MSGFDNEVVYCSGVRLEESSAQDIFLAQKTNSVSDLNVSGSPEGVVSANPASLAHDRSSGSIYQKVSGTGNTGWSALINTASTLFIKTITGDSGGAQSPSAGNFNILGTGSITSVGTAATETIQLTGLTNHAVLVGAGTATITKVAPSATAGVPLISNGSSSDPSFGTALVAGGGTGQTTLGNHSVLVGAGTSAVTSIATGTSGQVLTSNGASADPSFQTLTFPTVVAYLTTGLTNQTGDGTGVNPLIFDTTLVNTGSAYSTSTGIFTAPSAGNYMVSCTVMFNNLSPDFDQGELRFERPVGGAFQICTFNPGLNATSVTGYTNVYSSTLSGIVPLTASQDFRIGLVVRGGSKTVGIQGSTYGVETSLSIFKIGI